MKKVWIVVIAVLFLVSLWFVKSHYDKEAKFLKTYEKENCKLRLLAERRELQFKIATYESKLNLRVAKPVPPKGQAKPTPKPAPAPESAPVDPKNVDTKE